MELVTRPTAGAAARAMAGRITVLVRQAFATRGACAVAFSGGSSASELFAALVDTEIMWGRVDVYQVDERVAPDGDAARNATGLLHDFAERVGLPPGRLHLMDVTAADLPAAAARYAADLPERFDVVHLGLGDDGHTASWPPGDPVIDAAGAVALSPPFNGHVRMTLTQEVVNAAGHRLFFVIGGAKAAMLRRLLAGDRSIPAGVVSPSPTTVYADEAAAAGP
jgi:6-phosphogluconolactonase